ncbi:MAG: lectin MVL [Alphaproteobacteria bacterium]|nr:lectin MVL [Alphaproteobacteria bacterium]
MIAVRLTIALVISVGLTVPLQAQETRDVEVGPLWNQQYADTICPAVAHAVEGRWNGQWLTTRPGEMSVCGIEFPAQETAVEVGPIWNQDHAELVCPAVAHALRGRWTGHWWTTISGEMSVCQIAG